MSRLALLGAGPSGGGSVIPPSDLTFSGVQGKMSGSTSGINYTGVTVLAFAGADNFDTDAFHDPTSNSSRFVAPTDGYYQFYGQVGFQNLLANDTVDLNLRKNGASGNLLTQVTPLLSSGGTTITVQILSYPIPLLATDYLELTVQVASDTAADILASRTWFSLMKVG